MNVNMDDATKYILVWITDHIKMKAKFNVNQKFK